MTRKTNLAASVAARLLARARQSGDDYQTLLTSFCLERFLYRLGVSACRDRFVLKGAMLLRLWSDRPYRATRDLDLLRRGESATEAICADLLTIVGTEVAADAVAFSPDSIHIEAIRAEEEHAGSRATLLAGVGTARVTLQIDVGVGDSIWPSPMACMYPTLLDFPSPDVIAYPTEAVVAEKFEAMVVLGDRNSRIKDFFDIHHLACRQPFDRLTLVEAIRRTFVRRGTPIPASDPIGLTTQPAIFVPLQPMARGQLMAPPWPWNGTLSGAEVVPPSPSPAQALAGCFQSSITGTWVFWADRNSFQETACHVRRGPVGQNGPIVFSLVAGTVKWLQQRALTEAEVTQLQHGEWYLERVTSTLAQEVRAQIVPVPRVRAPSYGGGCADGRGVVWQLVETHGEPAFGMDTYQMLRYGLRLVSPALLPQSAFGYLAVGFRRDRNGAVPLPQRLDVFGGAPSCYLLTEAAIVVAAQSGGTTWDQIWFPSNPALRGQSFFAQGVLFDPAAQGYFAVSNGLHVTLR